LSVLACELEVVCDLRVVLDEAVEADERGVGILVWGSGEQREPGFPFVFGL
jgi:hypothetical protein